MCTPPRGSNAHLDGGGPTGEYRCCAGRAGGAGATLTLMGCPEGERHGVQPFMGRGGAVYTKCP